MRIKYLAVITSILTVLEHQLFTKTLEFKQDPAHDFFSLQATPTWKEYSLNNNQITFHKDKWAWVCSLTIKSKNRQNLATLTLQWKGKPISELGASLYQKKEIEQLRPIQKHHVCDGSWDDKTQQLSFVINEKIVAVNKYHLVLSFPKNIEPVLRSGRFTVAGIQTTTINK